MNKRKKTLRQLVVALLLLCTIGLPIQNIVLANEHSTKEEVITEETESATTAEADTGNSESMENESVPPSEKEAESTEITSSETLIEESKGLTDTPKFNSSEKQEASSATQQSEERLSTKAVTTGTFPNGSTSTWTFDDTTGELSISAGTLVNPNQSIADLIGVSADQIKSIVLEGQVIASGSLYMLFYACTELTSLDLSNFDTSQVTIMRAMFYGTSSLTSLDLSNFDTSQVTDMSIMFSRLSSLTSLDLSNFDTSRVTNMIGMFGVAQLQNLTLGDKFQFVNASSFSFHPGLSDLTPTAKYTGKWQNVGTGTVDRPKGLFVGTSTELMTQYDGSTMADTYVWQPVLAPVVVNVKDSTVMQGDTWNASDNFLDATDDAGNPVSFQDITVTGSVDTTQPSVYKVDYSYDGTTSTATITVLETMPESWINFIVDGTNVRAIPGSLLSKAEWDLTTGLWAGWNPGTIKVPTDKLP
ncbi:BspA family leucine-rich repeat surface protein, partial [Listeria innocua]|uniref:BspA family leucine-rich repeat surface protein n=1 Tax=Listeria innocua TaxID=1642 RepID=UPI0016262658